MADITRYSEFALLFGSTSIPIEPRSLEAGNDPRLDDLMSAGSLNVQLRQVVGKRTFLKATLLDPSLVTAWAKVGSGNTITGVKGIWRAYEQDGGFGAGYKSAAIAKGVIIPLNLQASVDKKATLDVVCFAIFAAGTGLTIGTDSGTLASVAKAYYLTSVTFGSGTAITALKSANVNWQYQVQDDEQTEPAYFYYDKYTMRGSVALKDIAAATAARIEDGATETVSLLLTDAVTPANTITVSLGSCHLFANAKGDECSIEFEKVG
jgi:hypothetical protein